MPIIFISLSETFTEKIKQCGFEAKTMKIQDYVPNPHKKTYYVSPANSLCFMDGGIDYALHLFTFQMPTLLELIIISIIINILIWTGSDTNTTSLH